MNNSFDTNLRLGDIREYDCTLGYRQSGVTVQWVEYRSNILWNNPLILIVNQSVNHTLYVCYVIVYKNPVNCPFQQINVSVTVKGIVRIFNNVYLLLFNRYIYTDSDD